MGSGICGKASPPPGATIKKTAPPPQFFNLFPLKRGKVGKYPVKRSRIACAAF